METNLTEYVITLRSHEELDKFYDDMETPGGNLYIPDRCVDVSVRRPISRNTNYLLTEEEATLVKNDPRVINAIPKSELDSIIVKPRYTQTSTGWSKSSISANTNRNWGLLRCVEGEQRSNWGSNGTTTQTGTITVTSSGKNVDVVIVDGHLNPDHPEFAVNPDGTGGSRVIQYNWYQHTSEVTGGTNGNYVYPTGSSLLNENDNHGMHVAGTVAGNTQGWARDANIYNISPYSNNPNSLADQYPFDYVRAFHRNKAINPLTGIKNPTICNNSWGSYYQITRTTITNVNWRGVNYTNGFTTNGNLDTWGLIDYTTTYVYVEAWTDALVADVTDAIAEGVLFVGAAGNSNMLIDSPGGDDYDNTITWSGVTRNYHRGSWNVTGGDSICVGAASALVNDSKASFSQSGPRINLYSPGDNIISSLHDGTVNGGTITTVTDSRNSSYVLGKYDGTSMASPQVCGVLACMLEQYPRMTQLEIKEYLSKNSKSGQLFDSGGGYTDTTSLKGSENKYLYYKKERPDIGVSQPKFTHNSRKNTGQVYPRRNTVFTQRS
jgi:hypothetical protein